MGKRRRRPHSCAAVANDNQTAVRSKAFPGRSSASPPTALLGRRSSRPGSERVVGDHERLEPGRRVGTTEKREPFGPSKGNHASGPGLPDIHAKRLPPEALSCRVAHARRSGTSGAPTCFEASERKPHSTKTARVPDRGPVGRSRGVQRLPRRGPLSIFDGLAVAPPCSEPSAGPRFSRLRRIERRRRLRETRGARRRNLMFRPVIGLYE
jgi:hypothetical protein